MLSQPDILIFDEATSSLDTISERHIHQVLESLKDKKRTTTYTLNLQATDKKKPALLKSLTLKDDNSKVYTFDREDLEEAASAEGHLYEDCLVKKNNKVTLTAVGEEGVTVKVKKGATANPASGNKVVAKAVVKDDGTATEVVFETTGADMETTTYTLKLTGYSE